MIEYTQGELVKAISSDHVFTSPHAKVVAEWALAKIMELEGEISTLNNYLGGIRETARIALMKHDGKMD